MSYANLSVHGHDADGVPPVFAIPAKKMAMWLFIIADSATFAACLFAYGYLRVSDAHWPRPFHSVTNVALMTFILVTSSLTMLFGIDAARAGDKAKAFLWTMVTAGLGLVFALLHLREWFGLIGEGVRLFQNPWGSALFGASFFSVTGLHLLHVSCGVIALVVVAIRYQAGRYNSDDVEIAGLYWHFVDLVWMFVVPLVYLLNLSH